MNILERERADPNFSSVVSFKSYCGALPAPESSNNSLGYKFSWSPKGVLRAAGNDARFLYEGKEIKVNGKHLMLANKKLRDYPGFAFEMIPNRDSIKYIDYYGLDREKLQTFMRGTLRFPEFCLVFRMFALLGFTSEETVAQTVHKNEKVTWKDVLIAQLPNVDPKLPEDQLAKKINDSLLNVYSESLPSETNAYLQPLVNQERETAEQDVETFIRCIKELGLWEEEVKDPEEKVIDALCRELEEKLSYMPNERDMIFMLHEFVIKNRNDTTKKIKASLCVYGNQNSSATSLTVGLPVAIASVMTLKGQIKRPGLVGPNEKVLYENVLKELEKEGIIIAETTE